MMSQKQLLPEWRLQAIVDAEVARLTSDCRMVAQIEYSPEKVQWDDECDGVGRALWRCTFLFPPNDPTMRAFIPILDKAIAPLEARYDLGLTRDV